MSQLDSLTSFVSFQILEWIFRIGRATLTIAIGCLAGLFLSNFVAGWFNVFFPNEFLVRYGPDVGWTVGAIAGTVSAVRTMLKPLSPPSAPQEPTSKLEWGWPGFKKFFSACGFIGLVGLLAGIALSLYCVVLLVAVTTCPLAPESWAPSFSDNYEYLEQEQERRRMLGQAESGVSMSINISHLLLWPMVGICTGSAVLFGLAAGAVLSFAEEVPVVPGPPDA